MARVTVEDCIEKVNNRFELVLMASKRAKDIDRGSLPSLPKDNDKPTIIALREIAEETISLEGLLELARRGIDEENDPFINANGQETEDDELSDSDSENSEDCEEVEEDAELDDEDLNALHDLDEALDDEVKEREAE